MSARPGFDVENADQYKRKERQQEHINRSVLSKTIKVLFVPNSESLGLKDVVKKFLNDVVGYKNTNDPSPLGWLKGAGSTEDTTNFRADMSSAFWDFFVDQGKRNLYEFNRRNSAKVKVIRGKTLQVADIDSLGLYLRRRIREYCTEHELKQPEVSLKNGYITFRNPDISENVKYKSSILAVLLGWNYSDWNGLPIKGLLTDHETKELEEGRLVWGSRPLESIIQVTESSSNGNIRPTSGRRSSRKREAVEEQKNSQKHPRKD